MVTAVCTKLRKRSTLAARDETVGGGTYTFDIWEGHRFGDEVHGFLREARLRARELRERVESYNAVHRPPQTSVPIRVVSYVGQTVITEEGENDD